MYIALDSVPGILTTATEIINLIARVILMTLIEFTFFMNHLTKILSVSYKLPSYSNLLLRHHLHFFHRQVHHVQKIVFLLLLGRQRTFFV